MTSVKITDLTAYTDAASTDVLPIVDVVADVTKKIAIGDIVKAVPQGTAALPGLAFDNDPNTGVYSPGADQVAISTNGTGRLFIDASGNVGIGTSSPSTELHIRQGSDTSANGIRLSRSNQLASYTHWIDDSSRYSIGYANPATANPSSSYLTIDNVGRVGVGTASPGRSLVVDGVSDTIVAAFQSTGTGCGFGLKDATTTADNTVTLRAIGNDLVAHAGGTERARIDSSGRLLVGTSSAVSPAGITPQIQLEGTSASGASMVIKRNSDDTGRAILYLAKSRGTSNSSNTIVQDNDILGSIEYVGADGSDISSRAASISCQVDGTPGSNDMPGRLVFSTTADGASSPTERMRIKNDGTINFSNVAVYADNAAATSGGLAVGDVYRTSTGQLMIRY
jgi:hypothetical protein